MNIAVSTVPFVPYYDLFDAIKACANLGFKIFEIPGDRPQAWPKDLRGRDRRRIRDFAKENDLAIEIISVDGSYLLGPGLCSEDETVRKDYYSYIQDLIELGHDLGCSKLIMLPGRPLLKTPASKGRELAVRAIGECADFAKDYGITVCVENTPFASGFFDTPTKLMDILKEVSKTNLSVRLDPCHCNVSKTKFRDFCLAFKGNIASVGIHDNKGDADSHLPIGHGNVKHKEAIELLREVGYDGSLTIEILPFEGWSVGQVEKYLSESKTIIERMTSSG
jgi:fructoselysine 3-epimerase